jgi:membrane protein implicated in regulation of membrane protease activity
MMTTMDRDRTFLKYLAMQTPGWLLLLVVVVLLRSWAAGILLVLAVVKDLFLYPYRRRAYEEDPRTGAERLVGTSGVVVSPVAPKGYVRVRGELWSAELQTPANPAPEGSSVTVVGGRGLTVTVERSDRPRSD